MPPISESGIRTQLVIPTNQKTFDRWSKHMAEVTHKFRRTLWADQRTNPILRHYLKSDSYLKFFG